MALNVSNALLAGEFNSIKARVKAEMLRRNQVGSLAAYGGAAYDYAILPSAGGVVLPEHVNKLVTPMNAIRATGYTTVLPGDVVPALQALDTLLTAAESYALNAETTNCAASCSGLCYGACNAVCAGNCTGGCSGTCTGSCTGCSGTCTGSCTGCSGTCSGTCKGTCRGCSGTCSGTCTGNCTGSCVGSCYVACAATCARSVGPT